MSSNAKEEREMFVVKSNDLIRKSRYNLTLQQQRIVLYAISKIKPSDTVLKEYEFKIADFCRACGITMDAPGYYYETIKNDFLELINRSWIQLTDGTEMTISWIGDAKIKKYDGTISLRFNPNMEPYLFELKERYTQYKLENVLCFSSTISIRLYELLRSYTTQDLIDNGIERTKLFTLNELRSYLNLEDKYPIWADFDRYVLRKSKEEINKKSGDISISYKPIKNGRRIESVEFSISGSQFYDYLVAKREKEKRFNKTAAKRA